MRWLLQIIDMGIFPFIGALVILLTKKLATIGWPRSRHNGYPTKRLSEDSGVSWWVLLPWSSLQPVYPQAENLSLNQVDVIQRTLNVDDSTDRERRITSLAAKVRSVLSISNVTTTDEKFLYTIVRDYQHYSLEIV